MRVQRCALEEIRVEWVPNFPLERLYIPEDMTKDICLGENRARKMGLKKLSLVMCTVVLENSCINSQANAKWRHLIPARGNILSLS